MRFFRVTELITLLLEAREERQLVRLRTNWRKLDLLVLDELGYVPASKVGAELLFDVITTAYERNSMIVTTNLPFEKWTEVLGSERLTGAALDRLTHRCHILETKAGELPAEGGPQETSGDNGGTAAADLTPGRARSNLKRSGRRVFRPARATFSERPSHPELVRKYARPRGEWLLRLHQAKRIEATTA